MRPPHPHVRRSQSLARRDYHDAALARGRPGKGPRVSELPPEIEATQEAEDLAQGRAVPGPKSLGEIEPGLLAKDQLGALPTTVCGREEEEPGRHRLPV